MCITCIPTTSLSLPSTVEVERDIIASLDYDSAVVRNVTWTYSIIMVASLKRIFRKD
jgi:hypothetical protein